jgi:sugar lactone lactonase YvrE
MKYTSLPLLLLSAGLVSAQDMPLHDILRPGETWQAHDGGMPARPVGGYSVVVNSREIVSDWADSATVKHPMKQPTACVVALGGSTLLIADATDRHVWAFRLEKDGTLGPGDRYMRLRVKGDDRRKKVNPPEAYQADPSALAVDAVNRTYVATNLGIQVFDPTGRLCGVFTAPPGRVTELAFTGDRLFARIADKVYVRRMLAEGK